MEPISQNPSLPKTGMKKNKAIKCIYVCMCVCEQEKMRVKQTRKSGDRLLLLEMLSALQGKTCKGDTAPYELLRTLTYVSWLKLSGH